MMINRDQKIEWIKNASNEELINQLKWAVTYMSSDSIEIRMDGQESFDLLSAEMLKRMEVTK